MPNPSVFAPVAALILLAAGCSESTGSEADLAPAPGAVADAETAPAAAEPASRGATGTSSAYGGAKRSAQNTADKVNQRQAELEKQLEEDE